MDNEIERLISEFGEDFIVSTIHTYWKHKKRILKEDYGIEWGSPAQLNPGANFD